MTAIGTFKGLSDMEVHSSNDNLILRLFSSESGLSWKQGALLGAIILKTLIVSFTMLFLYALRL